MSPPSILGYHSSVGKYRRSNIVKCCMAYIMALFQRSTKFIFCHVKSSLFASPRLGPVLKREENFIWYLKLARANILKRFSPQRRSNLSPGKSQSCRLSWYCYIIFALLFVRSSVLWLFLHCIYCVCTPKSKALGLYIFIKSLGMYALNGNGVMGHWDQYITLH